MNDVEVDQQPNAFAAKAEIRQKLGLMDGIDAVYALDLNHRQVVNEQINAITEFQFLSLVDYGQTNLGSHVKASLAEFVGQASLVCTLQQPLPKLGVDFQRRIDDGARYLVNAGGVRMPAGLAMAFPSIYQYTNRQVSSVILSGLCGDDFPGP